MLGDVRGDAARDALGNGLEGAGIGPDCENPGRLKGLRGVRPVGQVGEILPAESQRDMIGEGSAWKRTGLGQLPVFVPPGVVEGDEAGDEPLVAEGGAQLPGMTGKPGERRRSPRSLIERAKE